jgi:hypothetical protein
MRQDVYGVAYQEAKSELLDITCKFEQLRQRKTRLEGVVAALGPMVGVKVALPAGIEAISEPLTAEPLAPPQVETAETPSFTFNKVAAPAAEPDDDEDIKDPFERRVRNALKFGPSRREGLQHAV